MSGSFDEAPDRAFRPLAGFIDGANRSRPPDRDDRSGHPAEGRPGKIAMAPVVQQSAGPAVLSKHRSRRLGGRQPAGEVSLHPADPQRVRLAEYSRKPPAERTGRRRP